MKLLKVSEVAEMCRVRKETVYGWIKDGELAAIHFDRLVRVAPATLLTSSREKRKEQNNESELEATR